MAYGRNVDAVVNTFVPGINDDVSLTNVYVEELNRPGYHVGPALCFDYTRKGFTITDNVPQATRENCQPRQRKDGTMETPEEALQKGEDEVTMKVRHIVTNYVPDEKWEEKISEVESFEQFCKMVIDLLPKDYPTKKGQLICGLNKGGFIEIPRAMYVTGHFFSIGDKKNLVVKTREGKGNMKGYLNIQATQTPAQDTTSDTPATDTEW